MSWDHRVVRQSDEHDTWLGIHEAFYGQDKSEGPAWTENPVGVVGESIEELRETLHRMLACLDKPIIDDTGTNEEQS